MKSFPIWLYSQYVAATMSREAGTITHRTASRRASVRPYHSPSRDRSPWRTTSRATSESLITNEARSGASVMEIRSANTMVTERDAKNAPVTPPRNARGM